MSGYIKICCSQRWKHYVLLAAMGILGVFAGLGGPLCLRHFLVFFSESPREEFYHHLGRAVFWLLGAGSFFILSQGLQCFIRVLCAQEGAWFESRVSVLLYQKCLNSYQEVWGQRGRGGDLIGLFATDIAAARTLFDDAFATFLVSFLPILFAPFFIQIFIGIALTPILCVMGAYGVLSLCMGLRQSGFFIRAKEKAQARVEKAFIWIVNHRAAKALGWIKYLENKMIEARQQESDNRLKQVTNGGFLNAIAHCTPALIQLVGILELTHMQTSFSVENIFFMTWVLGIFILRPARSVPWVIVVIIDALTSFKRLGAASESAQLQLQNEDVEKSVKMNVTAHDLVKDFSQGYELEVSGLHLVYGDKVVLNDVSLRLGPGESVGLIGEVGSGKSTLIKCLIGQIPLQKGEVFINGIRATGHDVVMNTFSYVPQDAFLFQGTLAQNICLDKNCFSQERKNLFSRVQNSLRAAQLIYDFKQKSHELCLLQLGEKGVNISGGQKQRLSIARAYYFGRRLLLLDDCLSAVDVETEQLIIDTIMKDNEWKFSTKLIVTHRQSILQHCDKVYVLHEGRIVAGGPWATMASHPATLRVLQGGVLVS